MEQGNQGKQEGAGRCQDYLKTAAHRLYIGKAGATIVNTDKLDDPGDPDPRGDLLFLSPVEAVQIARKILAHAGELEAREPELEAQYEQVSQVLVRMFGEQWKPGKQAGTWFNPIDFEKQLHDAYNRLVVNQGGLVEQWHHSTFTDKFSYEQHQALFWRYFNRKYRDSLIEKYFPNEAEHEEEG
ncbi:MAG TPA: hypothetical protein VFA10_27100 [Ktedonobacteraceae bacterium]|nr:hypothetical protein [Ktedonobacteraceae bacterium]